MTKRLSPQSIVVILLLSMSFATLVQQVQTLTCPLHGPYAVYSQELPSDAESVFANFATMNTNTFMGIAYPVVVVDVWDTENVTNVWADLKRSNESNWTTMAMQRAPWRGNNSYEFNPSLLVSQTVTHFDVRFRANDTTGDMSTSQDFSFMITYSTADGPGGLDLMGIVTIIVFLLIAAIIPVFLYLLRRERIRLGLQAAH